LEKAVNKKTKSNIALAMLLFVFSTWASACVKLENDTIILDGEYIYIEKEDLITDVDSVQEEATRDIKKITPPVHIPGNLAVMAGANCTIGKYGTSLTAQQPLDVYMDRTQTIKFNMTLGADAGVNIYSLKVQGEKRLSLQAGFLLNKLKFESTQFADETQLMQDSVVGIFKFENTLTLQYLLIVDPGPPILVEEDTLTLKLVQNTSTINMLDLPLRLRWTQSIGKSALSLFGEAGVVYRICTVKTKNIYDNYLLNNKAEHFKLAAKDFEVSNKLYPTFSAGVKYYFNERDNRGIKFYERMNAGAYLQIAAPPSITNNSSLFYFDTWTAGLNVFFGFNF
jgi:hypothetical protein